jgi:hypothetical protein
MYKYRKLPREGDCLASAMVEGFIKIPLSALMKKIRDKKIITATYIIIVLYPPMMVIIQVPSIS